MNALGYLFALLPCGLLLFGFAVLIAVVDVRRFRGYALTILSSLLLACTIVVVGSVTIAAQMQPQPASIHPSSPNSLLLVVYFIPTVYASATILFTAAIEANRAHHWRWLVGFFISALVPVLLVVPPQPYVDMNIEYWAQTVGFLGMLVAPEATALAYSITRLVHPIAPAAASQGAPRS